MISEFRWVRIKRKSGSILLDNQQDELLQASRVSVKVLDTNDKWFGVTYKEDKDYVVKSFAKLIEDGVYQKNLFEDLK